jgi:serine O-acetyltransferase
MGVAHLLILALSSFRLAPHVMLMLLSPARHCIWADLDRWGRFGYRCWQPRNLLGRVQLFIFLMTFRSEYRTVFYLRISRFGRFLSVFCRPLPTLAIAAGKIGAGLYIEHGYSTSVCAEEIGENCWINHLVTVGHARGGDRPTIGNNVSIRTGATIVGSVRIGDNSTIGANSLVITDVPSNVTVMGVPAKIVWREAQRTRGAQSAHNRQIDEKRAACGCAMTLAEKPEGVTMYLVVSDFGRLGGTFIETDLAETGRETVVCNFLSGQYSNAVRVVAFNPAEGWSREVSEDIAGEVLKRALDVDENLLEGAKRFIDRHMGPGEKRPPAPSVWRETGIGQGKARGRP